MAGTTSSGFEAPPTQWPNTLTQEDDQCWPLVDSRSCWVSGRHGQSPWEPSSWTPRAKSGTPTTVTWHTDPVRPSQCQVVNHHNSLAQYEPWECLIVVSKVNILLCNRRQLWGHCSTALWVFFMFYGRSCCYIIFQWYIYCTDHWHMFKSRLVFQSISSLMHFNHVQ